MPIVHTTSDQNFRDITSKIPSQLFTGENAVLKVSALFSLKCIGSWYISIDGVLKPTPSCTINPNMFELGFLKILSEIEKAV